MGVYPGCPFYITVSSLVTVDVHLPNIKKLEKSQMHLKIVHIEEQCFPDPPGAHANNRDSPVYAVRYKPTSNRL